MCQSIKIHQQTIQMIQANQVIKPNQTETTQTHPPLLPATDAMERRQRIPSIPDEIVKEQSTT